MSRPPPNRVLSACAGSGKTYTLIERLCALLQDGAAPGEILVITFTRKAAEEITTRLLTTLEQRADTGEHWAALCRRRILLAETAADELNIYTFHSWFGLLLAGQCWSDGWYGPAELVEDDQSLRQQAWLRWLEKPPAGEALAAVLETCSPAALQNLLTGQVAHYLNAYRLLEDKTLAVPDTAAAAAALLPALQAFISSAAVAQVKAFDAARAAAQEAAAALDTAAAAVLPPPRHDTLTEAFFTKAGDIRKALSKAAEKSDTTALFDATAAAVKQFNASHAEKRAYQFHNNMLILAHDYIEQLIQVKNENHQMSFNDLEYDSYQAVKTCGDVNDLLYRVNEHYRHILIDEFQDTSPLQWHIIRCWLAAAAGEQAPSIFVVGDVKQAIYRFRHGEARLLTVAADYLTEHYQAKVEQNNCCYRLAPPLLSLINEIFSARLPAFIPHSVAPRNTTLPGRVEWHELDTAAPKEKPLRPRNPLLQSRPEDIRRQRWADAVADKTNCIIGSWQINAADAPRRARAEDILILLPQSTHMPLLRQALLRRGLSCAVRGSSVNFTDTLACRDITALLSVLLAPDANSLSLAQVLKSPLFACSEQTLAAVAAPVTECGGKTLWRRLLASRQPAARAAGDSLKRWRGWAQSGQLPVHDLLQRIFKDGQVFARYRAAVVPSYRRQVSEELSALLDFSLINDGGRQPLLRQFLAALPQAAAGDSGGGVRLMTVHGAKGLEAPIVILADCGFDKKHSGDSKQSVRIFLQWEPTDAAPRRFIFSSAAEKNVFSSLAEQEAQKDEQERENLFYVALTRAQQGLIIFSFAADDSPRLDALRTAMHTLGQEDRRAACTDGICLVYGAALAAAKAETAAAPPPAPPLAATAGEIIPAATIRAGARGSMLHQQLALLLRGVADGQINYALAAPELLPQAQALLATEPLPALLQAARRVAVETEFIHEERLLRIDLLIFTDEALWIIDYKTGSGDVAERPEYQQQMVRYIAGVTAVYSDKPIKAAFLTPRGFYEYRA